MVPSVAAACHRSRVPQLLERGYCPDAKKGNGKLQPVADPAHPKVHYGAFASYEAIIAKKDPFYEAAQHTRKIRAIELEVASLFSAAAEIEVPAFAVKGVSDYGTSEKDDNFHIYAAEVAARWIYAFVSRYATLLTMNS